MEDEKVKKLSSIICIFNERSMLIHKKRIKITLEKLAQELKEDDDSLEEKIHKLNFLTWLEFKLRHFTKAKERNEDVKALTNNDNISVLLGRAWIARATGDAREFNNSFLLLESLTSKASEALAQSRAQMAYCFCRLRTTEFLKRGIKIYTELVDEYPQNYNWRLGLGLAHRQGINRFFQQKQEHAVKAAGHFYTIRSESDDISLQRQALCQIASLKASSTYHELNLEERYVIFRKDLEELSLEARVLGADKPKTLTIIGAALMKMNKFDAAIEKLETSAQIKPLPITYFYLGKCYQRKCNNFYDEWSKRDENVSKAIENYRNCIAMSYYTNYSAISSLAQLLVKQGKIEEAEPMFSSIIDRSRLVVQQGYWFELYTSYQQKAYCLLLKAKESKNSPSEEIKSVYEYWLLLAVNLACASKMFKSNSEAIKFIIRPFNEKGLVIPRFLRQLRDYPMPIHVFRQKLLSLKSSKNYESAFTFLSFYGDHFANGSTSKLQPLMLEVKLYTVATRLQQYEESVHYITRPLLETIYKRHNRSGESNFDKDIHVLILRDGNSPKSLQTSSKLKRVMTKIYGLDVCIQQEANLQLICEELDSTGIALVLHDRTEKSRYFQEALAHIGNRLEDGDAPETGPKIVIGLLDDVQVDPTLSRLPSIQLEDFHWKDQSDQDGVVTQGREGQCQEDAEFTDHVKDLMKLYCCLIGQSWPL